MQQVSKSVSQPANKGGGVSVVPMGGTLKHELVLHEENRFSSSDVPFLESSTSDNAHKYVLKNDL